jgi:toxin ParE1/3/4
MRRLKVRFRPQAVADIENVYRYLLRAGATRVTAQRFVTRMRDRCLRIGNVPLGGRARDGLERGLRTVTFEHSAVIAYKVEEGAVRITNVFYGGRDYEALFGGDDEAAAGRDE